jgi:hypothetical protein
MDIAVGFVKLIVLSDGIEQTCECKTRETERVIH